MISLEVERKWELNPEVSITRILNRATQNGYYISQVLLIHQVYFVKDDLLGVRVREIKNFTTGYDSYEMTTKVKYDKVNSGISDSDLANYKIRIESTSSLTESEAADLVSANKIVSEVTKLRYVIVPVIRDNDKREFQYDLDIMQSSGISDHDKVSLEGEYLYQLSDNSCKDYNIPFPEFASEV